MEHDRAIIISTGDELMTGQLRDANACWLSERLVERGIMPVRHVAVGDDLDGLAGMFREAAAIAPLVIVSGGLGPTDGDLTREAVCRAFGDELVLDAVLRAALAAKLSSRGREMTARQERQAMRPRCAAALVNEVGTAPGLHVRVPLDAPAGDVFLLPGPPGELRPMFEREVVARLRPPPGRSIRTRLIHVVGMAEADCVDRLGGITRRDAAPGRPLVGITASGGILTIRVRLESGVVAGDPIAEAEREIRAPLGAHVLAVSDHPGPEALVRSVLGVLVERTQTLATVESCTGGMLGEMVTSVSGSSAAYVGGFITYANALKGALGVEAAALQAHGAVSPQVATQMAERGRERAGASFALAITGIAGPVGTVHIALASEGRATLAKHFVFPGDREDIRRRAAVSALTMLWFELAGGTPGLLLWERSSG